MHRVQTQKARLPLRLRLAPLANRYRRGPGLGVVEKPLAVARMLAQVIQMSHGDGSQARILCPLVEQQFALQNAPRCRAAQRLVRLVDRGQRSEEHTSE